VRADLQRESMIGITQKYIEFASKLRCDVAEIRGR